MMGPVQVVIVGFEKPTFSGEVLAEFRRLQSAGIVRLVDLLLVSRTEDGELQTIAPPDGIAVDFGEVAAALLAQPEEATATEGKGGAQSSDMAAWSLVDVIPAGGTAAVALIEHLWAAPLREAIQRTGGTPLDETWLAPADLELLDALMAGRQV